MWHEDAEYASNDIRFFMNGFADEIDAMVECGEAPSADYYINTIGGAALLWDDVSSTGLTSDIDVYSYCIPNGAEVLFSSYLMNTRSMAYPYALPYNYEDRLVTIVETLYCKINRVSWEDILFAKFQRNDDKDQNDADLIVCRDDFSWDELRYILENPDDACGSGITRGSYQELLIGYNACAARWNEYEYTNQEMFDLMDNVL